MFEYVLFVCKICKLAETLNPYFIVHLFILAIHYNEAKKNVYYNTMYACFYFITHGMHSFRGTSVPNSKRVCVHYRCKF
jgi:hypothetical protein